MNAMNMLNEVFCLSPHSHKSNENSRNELLSYSMQAYLIHGEVIICL